MGKNTVRPATRVAAVLLCAAAFALISACTDGTGGKSSIWGVDPETHDPVAKSWQPVGSTEFAQASVNNMAFVIGPDNAPYVFFSNTGTGGLGAVMKFVAGAWGFYGGGSAGFTDGTIDYPAMAFKANVLYVAYQDQHPINLNKITVMYSDGTPWSVQGDKGFSNGTASYISIAFDSSGNTCVAYSDLAVPPNMAIARRYNGSDWNEYFGASTGISLADAGFISLALSPLPGGNLLIAFKDDGVSPGKACVMEYTAAWNSVGTYGFTVNYAACITLAFDSGGIPYVGYQDGGNGDKASVMRYSGGAWDYVGAPGISSDLASYVSMAINSSGVIFIAYADWAASNKATVMKYADGAWSSVGEPGFTASAVDCIYVACDSAGDPYICYRDPATLGVTVMAYK